MHKQCVLILCSILAIVISTAPCCCAYENNGGQVGDATVTPGLFKQNGLYGVSNPLEDTGGITFGTRHHRFGNDTGIGNSFLQTTSPTTESQPVATYSYPLQTSSPAISSPSPLSKPQAFSEGMLYKPLSTILAPEPSASIISPAKSDSWSSDYRPYNLIGRYKESNRSLAPIVNTDPDSNFLPDDLK